MNDLELNSNLNSIFSNIESLIKKDMNMLLDVNEFNDIKDYFSNNQDLVIKNLK